MGGSFIITFLAVAMRTHNLRSGKSKGGASHPSSQSILGRTVTRVPWMQRIPGGGKKLHLPACALLLLRPPCPWHRAHLLVSCSLQRRRGGGKGQVDGRSKCRQRAVCFRGGSRGALALDRQLRCLLWAGRISFSCSPVFHFFSLTDYQP